MPPAHHVGVELVISGWAHTPFGKHQATLEDLISIVVRDASPMLALTEGHRRDRPRQLQRRHERAGIPVVPGLAGTPRPGPAARDARRERMCVRVSAATVQVKLGIEISMISIGDSITDPDGTWAQVSGLESGGAVVVRPDNHIGWRSAAASSAPAEDLLDAVTRLLHR